MMVDNSDLGRSSDSASKELLSIPFNTQPNHSFPRSQATQLCIVVRAMTGGPCSQSQDGAHNHMAQATKADQLFVPNAFLPRPICITAGSHFALHERPR